MRLSDYKILLQKQFRATVAKIRL